MMRKRYLLVELPAPATPGCSNYSPPQIEAPLRITLKLRRAALWCRLNASLGEP